MKVERSARVLDGAVVVIDAVSGVQAQTRTVWKQTKKQSIPAIAFINKMDRNGADFMRATESIRSKLGGNAVPIQMPIGKEEDFIGLVDLLSMTILTFDVPTAAYSRSPKAPQISALDINSELYQKALSARRSMIESIAEVDDILMEKYLESDNEGIDLMPNDLIPALRRACIKGDIVPTLCGASLRCKGVEPLLDSIITFLPSPQDRADSVAVDTVTGKKRNISPSGDDLCALAFKVVHDPMRGTLVYLRVYSGTIESKQMLYNSTQRVRERLNQLMIVNADDFIPVDSVGPGSVVCLIGMKGTLTGDTIVADKGPLKSYVLDGLSIPEAVFSLAIEPEKSSQQPMLDAALAILCVEDPSLRVELDKESGQTLLRGIGELHLDIVCDKIRRQFNIDVSTGRAYVNYRESITDDDEGPIIGQFVYDRTLGTKRMYASLSFEVTPKPGTGLPTISISDEVKEIALADEQSSLKDALTSSFSRGPQGFPVTGFHVRVVGMERDHDTTAGAVRACASLFMDSVLRGDRKMILEPIMAVEIELPPSFLGEILSDLTSKRRGNVKEILNVDGSTLSSILADVPLATMLGYATSMRSMTQGEGSFAMEYLTHSPVEQSIANEFLNSG
jgi:elongation factor G